VTDFDATHRYFLRSILARDAIAALEAEGNSAIAAILASGKPAANDRACHRTPKAALDPG